MTREQAIDIAVRRFLPSRAFNKLPGASIYFEVFALDYIYKIRAEFHRIMSEEFRTEKFEFPDGSSAVLTSANDAPLTFKTALEILSKVKNQLEECMNSLRTLTGWK